MSAQDHLAGLPEPIQQALVNLVTATAGLGQTEKLAAVFQLRQPARGAGAWIGPVMNALSAVVDEVHTASEPSEKRASLAVAKRLERESRG